MKTKESLDRAARLQKSQSRALQSELVRLNVSSLEDPQATPQILDFRKTLDRFDRPTGKWRDIAPTPMSPEGYSLNRQQIMRRRNRAVKRFVQKTTLSEAEASILYKKPLREWDNEELARGRPRDKDGSFTGPKPEYVTGEMHEEAMDRFTSIVRTGMRVATVDALEKIKDIINNEDVDNRGKPLVGASTKLDAAKFLIEHIIGKPTQRIESDVSVKLQGILGAVMVNPDEAMGYTMGHMPGYTMELAEALDTDEVVNDG